MSDIAERWSFDEGENVLIHNRVQDVEPIIEHNKYLQTVDQRSDWGRHVAHVPNIFLEKWLREEWNRGNVNLRVFTPEFDALIERKINDPDWKFLRVDKSEPGQVSMSGLLGFGS